MTERAIPPEPDASELHSLVAWAGLAPSSHNTQPWYFQIQGRQMRLFADRTRALPVNDPDDRELTISCGCALMNLRVAVARAGSAAVITPMPDTGDEDLLAVLDLAGRGRPDPQAAELFPAIATRRTYRKPFLKEPISATLLGDLAEAARVEAASFSVLEDADQRQVLTTLVAEGDALQWEDPRWRRELAAWMHPRREGDGLHVPGLLAPLAKTVVRSLDLGSGVARRDRHLSADAPVVALIGSGQDAVDTWLQAGQALQRILLTAALAGLQASYLNQPIQVTSLRPKLQSVFATTACPQILLRLGHPTEAVPASPRRQVEDLLDACG